MKFVITEVRYETMMNPHFNGPQPVLAITWEGGFKEYYLHWPNYPNDPDFGQMRPSWYRDTPGLTFFKAPVYMNKAEIRRHNTLRFVEDPTKAPIDHLPARLESYAEEMDEACRNNLLYCSRVSR